MTSEPELYSAGVCYCGLCANGEASVLAAAAALRDDVASRQKKRNLQIRGSMDGVRYELERPAGQALSSGSGQLRGGVQQQGADSSDLVAS